MDTRTLQKISSISSPGTADESVLLAEYQAIEEMHKHFDTMNLSMMSTITAAVFILWGIMLGNQSIMPFVLVVLQVVVLSVLSTWIRYMSIHRSIVVRKLARACEIEEELGMRQNLIFQYNDDVRRQRRRPGAHAAEVIMYWLLSVLGIAVMVYGYLAPSLPDHCSIRQLWDVAQQQWGVIAFGAVLGLFALYWGFLCRTLVAEVTPYYELPPKGVFRWLLVNLGRYRDLHDELSRP